MNVIIFLSPCDMDSWSHEACSIKTLTICWDKLRLPLPSKTRNPDTDPELCAASLESNGLSAWHCEHAHGTSQSKLKITLICNTPTLSRALSSFSLKYRRTSLLWKRCNKIRMQKKTHNISLITIWLKKYSVAHSITGTRCQHFHHRYQNLQVPKVLTQNHKDWADGSASLTLTN